MRRNKKASRRDFLKTSGFVATAIGLPTIVPASALGRTQVAPSNRIAMGMIGTGGKGRHNMGTFLGFDDVQVLAVCDVDKNHAERAKNDGHLGGNM